VRLWGALLLVPMAVFACSEEAPPLQASPDGGAPPATTETAPPEEESFVPDTTQPLLRCPDGMALVERTYCIDKWEAYVVELDANGAERPHSPFYVVDGLNVRAKTAPNVTPQGYISQVQASKACKNAGKRLCARAEFELACKGPSTANWYPYGGQTKKPGYCNEGKGSTVARFFGSDSSKWTYANFNDPKLNQWEGGLAKTGAHPRCVSPYGVFDCVGNLHEWDDDPADARGRGRFRGGFYGDAEINGHGCLYVTSAHELTYHDYSTGFRCCADPKP
jgi:sulfatase modifying factor 1